MLRVRLSNRHLLTWSPDVLRDQGRYRRLPVEAWRFLECLDDDSADHVAIATYDDDNAGWFRCTVLHGTLHMQGTWVNAEHRLRGVATALWEHTLDVLRPEAVTGHVVSNGGTALIRKMKRARPAIDWFVRGLDVYHPRARAAI
jgi:GNAT superfamily N-acetyltransferase